MPTENPRINVTLPPALDNLVSRLAKQQRMSKSNVIRDLLEAVEPSLTQALALMEAAEGASKHVLAQVAKDMKSAVVDLERSAEFVALTARTHTRDLVQQAETVRGKRPGKVRPGTLSPVAASPRKRKDPPSSNRGVKS